jgi:peptidoglycan/LPS O-acetylase OafA/YrhL
MRERTVVTNDPHEVDDTRRDETRRDDVTDRESRVDPSRIVAMLAGIGLLVLGAVVLLDTGFDGFPDEPTTEVAGMLHTPLLGVIDVGLGALLLAGAAAWSRAISTFTAALMIAGGLVVAFASEDLPTEVATTSDYGWMLVIVGAVVMVVDLLAPTVGRRHRVMHSAH